MPADATPAHTATSLAARLMTEGLIGMAQAAKYLGTFRDGKPTHPATPTRWASTGVKLADDTTVKLEAIRLNGRLATSRAALVRFIEAQQDQQGEPPAADQPTVRTPVARKRADARAEAKLISMGC